VEAVSVGTAQCARWRRVRILTAGVAAGFVVLITASPASAHVVLLFSNPAANSSVPASPRELILVFDSPVSLPATPIRLTGAGGQRMPLVDPATSRGGTVVTVAVNRVLPTGVYTVDWQAVADDGDAITGRYEFGVGPAAAGMPGSIGSGVSGTAGQWLTAAARWASFAALAWLAGLAVFARLVRRSQGVDHATQRSGAVTATLTGLAVTLLLFALVVGNGSVPNAIAHPASGRVGSRPGLLALVEVAAYAVAACVALSRLSRWIPVPLLAVVAAEAMRAHPQTYAPGWGEVLTAIHLTAASVWAGTLLHVLRQAWARRGDARFVRTLFATYARLALWLFAAVVVTGVANALIVVPISALLRTGYGAVLLVKLALVAGAAALALAGRLRLRVRELPLGTARLESLVLLAVLAVSAGLTVSAPPRTTSKALPFAPPPSGPVVPLGARASQIGVSVQASAGQLVLRLSAPGAADTTPGSVVRGDTAAPRTSSYRLSAALTDPAGRTSGLSMRGCGPGCFVAATKWRSGTSQLSLQAEATGWTGGQVALAVPWPPHNGAAALTRTVNNLTATRRLVVYERVTSDTSAGLGHVRRIEVSGPDFLATEPYGTGNATIVDTVANKDGSTTVLLGYPAENINADLTVDPSGRILRETLSTPNQLVTRAFDYRRT
jgi:copper transport protein